MAHAKFPVEVLTPDGEIFAEEVEMISTRTTVGSIGILANHAPLLAMLDPTELRLYKSESDVVRFAQGEGYLQVGGNRALLLVEEAHDPGSLDVSDLRDRLQQAEGELERAEENSEGRRIAERNKRRWEMFIKIAESS
jgi:F-type H+-transporting ATPase subunit epsilon